MKPKHLVYLAGVVLVGVVCFAAGYAAGPDPAAHLLARSAEEWTALAAWVAVAIALAAALIGWVQAREARRLRIEQAQPQIVAYLEQDPDIPDVVEIVIGNFGTTAAHDVVVSTDVPVRTTAASAAGEPEVVPLPSRFATLAPGQRWRTAWDFGTVRSKHPVLAQENRVTFWFDYEGVDGKPVRNESDLDWAEVAARWWTEKKTVHHAAMQLVEIRKALVALERAVRRPARAQTAAQPEPDPSRGPNSRIAVLHRILSRRR